MIECSQILRSTSAKSENKKWKSTAPPKANSLLYLDKVLALGARDNWQYNTRRALRIVIDRLLGDGHTRAARQRFAGVQVAIVLREGARRNLDADPVAALEHLRGIPA